MSKRSFRRLAVVAGAALAVGSMAPAMALRIDANETTDASVEVGLPALPEAPELPELPALPALSLPALPTYAQVNGTILGAGLLAFGGTNTILGTTFSGVDDIVGTAFAGVGALGGDCAAVAVASCNDVRVPVNASGVLGGGVLNGTEVLNESGIGSVAANVMAPITAGVMAPIAADVSNVVNGGILNGGILSGNMLGGGLLGPIGGMLDLDAAANVLALVAAF